MRSGQTTDLGAGLGTAHDGVTVQYAKWTDYRPWGRSWNSSRWCDSMRSGQTTDVGAGLGTAHDGVTVCGVDRLQTSGQVLVQLMMV